MKISKEARKVSREMFRHSFTSNKLDEEKISEMVQSVIAKKPRHFVDMLKDYQRLLKLEVDKRHALIESATPLNRSLGDQIVSNLKARYGEDLTTEFRTNPELLGGLRIRVGSDVWDGSVKSRLNKFQEQLL
ncbi:MAG: F0F1 ATP synthase subunit delta [Verrucomicrobia bacterium]|jgi:F-type H+-transporting ATPase subunit delta|nr:F0F1 ATP synthase subunit delta [Verrucomicrobiota bacterium]MBV8417819.1 F0F1 ATP synthase subunit delta [Verrucomicrobiota bacterium]MBV8640122.1 F0F1 ATP synthase subunit delta [Verrucomicrobiota bacterium]